MSSPEGSISHWISLLKAGQPQAAQELWQHYFQRLVGVARQILAKQTRTVADEEDAALSAFASFCRCAALDRFPQLLDRDDLWQVLVTLTARKAHRQLTRAHAQKRGGQPAETPPPGADSEDVALDQILSRDPTPEFAAQVAEEYQRLLDSLGDAHQLKAVAVWKLEGYSNEEIAAKLGRGLRSIERKLQMIRSKLQMLEEADQEDED